MTPTQIQEAYSRAKAITDGFRQPSARCAHDVIALVKHINGVNKPQQSGKEPLADIKKMFGL